MSISSSASENNCPESAMVSLGTAAHEVLQSTAHQTTHFGLITALKSRV
jgi:hypothetical protein